jgi:hypothetical protein
MSHNTDISISSNALLLLGHTAIASFTEGGAGATVASNLYELTYESLLTMHRWRFAVGQKTLNQLVDTPLNKWRYAYQLPSDFLKAIKVFPHTDYDIFENKLYTNSNEIDLDYVFKPAETRLPPYFVETLQFKLAALFAFPVTSNKSTGELYEKMYMEQLARAKSIDSQGQPNVPIVDSPFTDVRF